jgi:hypothetical protein
MCGLVSIIPRKPGGLYAQDMELFEQMLVLDQFRGKDSAGAMMCTKGGDQMIVKHASKHVTLMFETPEWKQFRGRAMATGRYLVGHNRAATRGGATTGNAHPFVEGRISLVHNGTLRNERALLPEGRLVDVDSQAIAIALSLDTPQNVIPKIEGAFALIWYNNEEEKLYATRNNERPLSLCTTENYYFLMSEPWMLLAPWSRQNGRAKIEEVREIEPGEFLSFDLTGKMERSEVTLSPEKKCQTTGTTTTGCANDYRTCRERQDARVAAQAAQQEGIFTEKELEDDLETELPFAQRGTATPQQQIVSQQVLDIRKLLAESAKRKQEHTRSTSCALTRPAEPSELTNTIESGSNGSSIVVVEDGMSSHGTTRTRTKDEATTDVERYIETQESRCRNIVVQSEEFPRGAYSVVKIVETKLQGKFMRWWGKIRTPGKTLADCTGVLPEGIERHPKLMGEMLEDMCTGKVKFCTYTTGGLTVWIENVVKAGYTDVHGTDIPWAFWNKALIEGCSNCGGHLFDWERTFTSVVHRGEMDNGMARNVLKSICPDCLMKGLPEGEVYDRYTKNYYEAKRKWEAKNNAEGTTPRSRHSSVQNRVKLGTTSSGKDGGTPKTTSGETLQ